MENNEQVTTETNNNNDIKSDDATDNKPKQSRRKGKLTPRNASEVLPRRGRPPNIPDNIMALFENSDEVPGLGPKPSQKTGSESHGDDFSQLSEKQKGRRLVTLPEPEARKLELAIGFGNVRCDDCGRSFSNISGYKRHLKPCQDARGPAVVVKVQKIPVSEAESEEDEAMLTIEDIMGAKNETTAENVTPGHCPCCDEPKETCHTGSEQCPKCDKKFSSAAVVERHLKLSHKESAKKIGKMHQCDSCMRQFSRKYHLDRHKAQTGCDGRPKTSFPCEVCGKQFSRKDNLREHLRAHAGQVKRKRKYACESCGKVFAGLTMLQIHLRSHSGERPFHCEFCDKSFMSKNALQKHRRTHTGERPFQCTQCKARFAAKETLNRHTRTHSGSKPHTCTFCGKSFIQPSQLKAHLFHHTGENGFTCVECGRCFNRRNRLQLHVKFVHQGAEPFTCDQCQKSFVRKEDLARHLFLHEGVKPHKCYLCDKSFSIKSALKVHLVTHTKEPPTSCEECGRAFIRQDCLLRHMRIKHRDTLENIMAEGEKKKIDQQQQQQQQEQLTATNGTNESSDEGDELSKRTLSENIAELLSLLVDESTLRAFGWPEKPVADLLDAVINRCGHQPVAPPPDGVEEDAAERERRLRENAKLLFTVVIDDVAVKALLQSQSVDEVVLHVLKLAKN